MSNSVNTIFSQPVFGGAQRKPNAQAAAQGFSSIFGEMLAKEMRKAMVGDGSGMAAMGAGSDIMNGFFDEAMGKALASSPAMRPLDKLLFRELGGSGKSGASGQTTGGKFIKTGSRTCGSCETGVGAGGEFATPPIEFSTQNLGPSDDRGPLLLPPPPSSMAPILPPPSPLES